MPATTSLDILLEAARTAFDGESRRLGEELGRCRAAEERLALLERYRHDYEQSFRERGAAGLSMGAWSDYRLFLGQLDAAIAQQRRVLDERRGEAARRRESWSAADMRRRRYDRLAERRLEAARSEEQRAEQRLLDELAARGRSLRAAR